MAFDTHQALEPVQQFSVFLSNRPGTLCALVKLLNDNSLEVLGLSTQDSSDMTLVRLVVTDPDAVGMLFMEKGIPHDTRDILIVRLAEPEDNLSRCLQTLLCERINILFSYPLFRFHGMHPVLAFALDDPNAGRHALATAGFVLLTQSDLSR